MFKGVLIANRGEIALRIIRTLREMDVRSIAVYSDADCDAPFVRAADDAYRLGPSPATESYLNAAAILSVAKQAGADAVHPGYGFLAENADFADAVESAGLTFIGPSASSIRLMGNKVRARQAVARLGVPVVPGSPGLINDVQDALAFGKQFGYPVAVKAAGGGGGRGIRVVTRPEDFAEALERASREAGLYFKNPDVYLERYFPRPRHVEVQVLGDQTGRLIHLGERDCSAQRRHQKLIEESPSPAVDRNLRERMGEMALRAAEAATYVSAGTVEFLLSEEGEFFFLEMNTRIQVEHPVTELVAETDLIRNMVLIAAGEPMEPAASLLDPRGHAIEVRINAEDPVQGFRPNPGPITSYRPPGGIGVRVDSGVEPGFVIPSDYDSLLAKLVVWAPDRERARRRAIRALDEFEIRGPASTIPFARAILNHPDFVHGQVWTTFVESNSEELTSQIEPQSVPVDGGEQGRLREPRIFEVEVNRKRFSVRVAERQTSGQSKRGSGRQRHVGHVVALDQAALISPMHGTVAAIRKQEGETIEAGEPIFIVEAMKMENEIRAHRGGHLSKICVGLGDTVETGQPLAEIT